MLTQYLLENNYPIYFLTQHYTKLFEKQGCIVSSTNPRVLLCSQPKKLRNFNFNVQTKTFKFFPYYQKTRNKRFRPTPRKPKKLNRSNKSLYLDSIIPDKNTRTTFHIIMRLFRETYHSHSGKRVISQAQIIRAIHYLKAFKMLSRKDIEVVITRYRHKSILNYFIETLEKSNTLPLHYTNFAKQDCLCFIYKGRTYLCYRYFAKPLEFTLLSARLMHHKITINKVQYYPLDILKELKPKKHKMIHNIFRYKIANIIAQYVETLPKQIID